MSNTLTAPPSVRDKWPPPNFVDPETEGPALMIVSIILSALGLLVVILRLFSRTLLTRVPGLDDLLIVIALALCIALTVLLIIGTKEWYVGYHIWDLPAASVVDHRKGMWVASYVYILASGCIKISVLLFYRRLSVTFSSPFLIATWIGIAYNAAFMIAYTIANSLICSPIEAYWLRYDLGWRMSHQWSCGNEGISLPANGAFSVLGDLYSTIIPLILIISLDIPRKQKLALYTLFGIGFLVVGAGAARLGFLVWMVQKTYDFTWVVYKVWIWSMVELYVAILVASAPALKPLLRSVFGESFLGRSDEYGGRKRGMTESEDNDHAVDLDKVKGDRRSAWSLASLTTRRKLADLERRQGSDDEDKQFAKSGASIGNHESIRSDTDTYSYDAGNVRRTKSGRWKPTDDGSNTNSIITEEEKSEVMTPSQEVDPPIFPGNFSRKSHHRHRQQNSDSTIGTAITTDDKVEAGDDRYIPSHTRQSSSGDGWPTQTSRPYTAHPPTSYRGPQPPMPPPPQFKKSSRPATSASASSKRQSWGSIQAARIRAEANQMFNQVRVPFYDAESSHQVESSSVRAPPSHRHKRTQSSKFDTNDSSGYNSESDERRDEAILTAAQQSRMSGGTTSSVPNGAKTDTRRSSSDKSLNLPLQGAPMSVKVAAPPAGVRRY